MSVTHDRQDVNGWQQPKERLDAHTGSVVIYYEAIPSLAMALAASYANGDTDAAGADALVMNFDEWQEHIPAYEFEPEPAFWQEG